MKLGIITYTHGTNIGQRLQNYALQSVCEELGHQAYTIKQGSPVEKETLRYRLKKILVAAKYPALKRTHRLRQHKFDDFNNKYIQFYGEEMPFYGDNSHFAKQFDAFIVGSDQIWSPLSCYVGDNAFLTFAKVNQRLTYAPSLSVETLPAHKADFYKDRLNGFWNISVREHKGAEIIEKLTGRHAEVLVDPTLLLTRHKWDQIRENYKDKPSTSYILAMFLSSIPDAVSAIANKLKLKVILLDDNSVISPAEFLDLVSDAQLTLTDSFHATVFSAIYHIPFINFDRSDYGETMSSRFETLYRVMGIKERRWNKVSFMTDWMEMDYKTIDKHIEIERDKSIKFLKKEFGQVYVGKEDMDF